MQFKRMFFRAWYYFRIGYSTYLAFLFGFMSTVVSVYYLAIKNIPMLEVLFPSFTYFTVLAAVVAGPLSVLIGYTHFKRTPAYSSEAEIGTEANPYNYKLIPGYWREVFFPALLMLLRQVRELSEKQGTLSDLDRKQIDELKQQFEILLQGGSVGKNR